MKKLNLILLFVIMLTGAAFSQKPAGDFREFRWGDSLSEVKRAEKARFVSQEKSDMLVYEDNLGGLNCDVIFDFNFAKRLISGSYIFTRKYPDPQLYLRDYNNFKQLLVIKYGKPDIDVEEWAANVTPSIKENYGAAIGNGKLVLMAIWNRPRTIVKINLVSVNQRPSLQILYTCRSMDELENMEDLRKALPKL